MEHIASTPPPPQESIEPYLNPRYWNGQTLGDKTGQPMNTSLVNPRYGAARQALRAFDTHRRQGGSIFALETFRSGDSIDPNAHPFGSIFILATERLIGIDVANGIADKDWSDVPVPSRPDILEERLLSERPLIYVADSELGIVTAGDKRGSQQLTCISVVPLVRTQFERTLLARRRMNVYSEPIAIGKEQKYRCDCVADHNSELITRIPKAILVAPGEVQKDKKSAFSWLGKLASQPSN